MVSVIADTKKEMKNKTIPSPSGFEKISAAVTKASGSSAAFVIAFGVILVWLLIGPFVKFSTTWQLAINTITTITTFLMVFLIQRGQNKDSVAIHLKLNELVVAHEFASNRLVAVENITEEELKVLQKYYKHIAALTGEDLPLTESHSIEQANARHESQKAIKTKAGKVTRF